MMRQGNDGVREPSDDDAHITSVKTHSGLKVKEGVRFRLQFDWKDGLVHTSLLVRNPATGRHDRYLVDAVIDLTLVEIEPEPEGEDEDHVRDETSPVEEQTGYAPEDVERVIMEQCSLLIDYNRYQVVVHMKFGLFSEVVPIDRGVADQYFEYET